jgi:hypothetical protein
MQFCAKNALRIVLLGIATVRVATAGDTGQNAVHGRTFENAPAATQPTQGGARLLGRTDGLTILNVALRSGQRAGHSLDCSHFVHSMYERAGFSYPYASSLDLYQGIDEFRRVTTPQPGDLAVWRGHTGIVVDPVERSFLSVLHAGPSIDYYDSRYWKQRGHPRFYRYVKQRTNQGASDSVRRASLKADSREKVQTIAATSKENSEDGENFEEDRAVNSPQPALARQQPEADAKGAYGEKETHNSSVSAQDVNASNARELFFGSGRPKADEVRAAFLQASNDSEARLRSQDLFKSERPVIVFDRFDVAKMHFSKNGGWIDVQIESVMVVAEGRVDGRSSHERQRWTLSRSRNNTWSLTPDSNAIYLSQSGAERVVAHTLATLTDRGAESPADRREKTQLSHLLNSLFEK